MKYKQSIGSKAFDIINCLLMIFFMIIILYPFLNIIAVSFSDASHIGIGDITIWPKGFTLASYAFVFKDPFVYRGYFNSIVYAIGTTAIMLVCTSLMAYPLSISGFIGKKFITIFLTITMFFGGGLIPTYLLMRNLHLLNTVWVMIIPGCVGAFNVFLFRTFFQSIPNELRESALLDGANDIVILFKIILPLSKALIATFALFGIVGSWNSWFNGLIYLQDQNKYPLQLILRNYLYVLDASSISQRAGVTTSSNPLLSRQLDPQGIRMGMVVVTMFPIMMIYPFFQKYFVKGIMIGAIKG